MPDTATTCQIPAQPFAQRDPNLLGSRLVVVRDPYVLWEDQQTWSLPKLAQVFGWTDLTEDENDVWGRLIVAIPDRTMNDLASDGNLSFWEAWNEIAKQLAANQPTNLFIRHSRPNGHIQHTQFGRHFMSRTARTVYVDFFTKEFFDQYGERSEAWMEIFRGSLNGLVNLDAWYNAGTVASRPLYERFANGDTKVAPTVRQAARDVTTEVIFLGGSGGSEAMAFTLPLAPAKAGNGPFMVVPA